MEYSQKIAELLLQIKAIKLNPKDPFTWASGLKSPIYCDNRISLSHPYVRNTIKSALATQAGTFEGFEMIAGVATAGIPHGALLADALGCPFCYVRSKAKKHGRQNQIEGDLKPGQKVLVVEDLISTGGSSIEAIAALRDYGVKVIGLLAIFTYEFKVATDKFSSHKVPVSTLTCYTTLLDVAKKIGYIDSVDLKLLKSWRESPSTWQLGL